VRARQPESGRDSGRAESSVRRGGCPLGYGEHSGFYFFTDPSRTGVDPTNFDARTWTLDDIKACATQHIVSKLRLALLVNGVDISGKPGGIVSGVHSAEDVERTADAARAALRALRAEGELH